ncbi:MAG: hypothetical protein KF761_01080 [Salinibacterium sp.]|nr:hypothetical protein [Salinibacterium sp.]
MVRPRRERVPFGPRRIAGLVIGALVVVALGATSGWVLANPQRVTDQLTVWNYTADSVITAYADRSTMTDEGRFLFYASRPEVSPDSQFNAHCSSQTEGVGILGCYQHAGKRIYLYDVTDVRLDGIEEVVAAHEMLHAVWDRMSVDERTALGPLLEAAAATKADDPEFAKTLSYYATAEPGERLNELHSIVGTEFHNLDPALEAHYARYFTDREALVELHDTSHAVFQAQQDAIDALLAQLDALQAGVDADYASYNAGYDQLNADIAAFNSRAQAGDFSSQSQFNGERNALIARQADLDALYASIDDRAKQYEGLVAQLNDLNAQVDELNKSINISPRSDSNLGN